MTRLTFSNTYEVQEGYTVFYPGGHGIAIKDGDKLVIYPGFSLEALLTKYSQVYFVK